MKRLREHLGLICILLAGIAAVLYIAPIVSDSGFFLFHSAQDNFGPELKAFREKTRPTSEINFTDLYGGSGQFQVLHSMLDIRRLKLRDQNPSCAIGDAPDDTTQETGLQLLEENFPGRNQTKREMLERFLNAGVRLPEDFITTAPFVDGWGSSYAYLLSQNGPAEYNNKTWVEQHLSFFRLTELTKVLAKYKITDLHFSIIARLDDTEMAEIIRGGPIAMTRDYLLVRNESRYGFSPLSYWVYDLRDVRGFLSDGKYELIKQSQDSVCIQRIGNACWTFNSKHLVAYIYRYSIIIIFLIASIIIILMFFYARRTFERSREQRKNRLALQVLSHEFRTPVSSMLVMIDQLSKNQNGLNEAHQDLVTRISGEAFRLQRIIEVSKNYLQTESHRIHFNYIEIPSVNQWISDLILETNQNIQTEFLDQDHSMTADPFWLKFILSSLIQNAFAHGKPPVFIRLKTEKNKLSIRVEDHGECDFESLNDMTSAFVRSNRSNGMGLGLNIVHFIISDWGTKMYFSKSPTAFTLVFNK